MPVWAVPAALLTLGALVAVLPGSPAVAASVAALEAAARARRQAKAWGGPAAWGAAARATAPLLATDGACAASIFAFVKAGEAYGRARHGGILPPYPGPWRRAAGGPPGPAGSAPPRWFVPAYLLFAASIAFVVPFLALAASALPRPGGAPPPAAAAALVPYLALFAFQWGCEVAWLRASPLAPAVPLAFMLARPWQLARGLAIAGGGAGVGAAGAAALHHHLPSAYPPAPGWVPPLLRALALFWTFDTAALLVWLPFTFNVHLLPHPGGVAGQ